MNTIEADLDSVILETGSKDVPLGSTDVITNRLVLFLTVQACPALLTPDIIFLIIFLSAVKMSLFQFGFQFHRLSSRHHTSPKI